MMRRTAGRWSAIVHTAAAALLLIAAAGCGEQATGTPSVAGQGRVPPPEWSMNSAPKPHFHINVVEMEQAEIPRDQQVAIATALEAMFGTPDEPFVLPESGLESAKVRLASGPVWTQPNDPRGLYRQHCGHCHGTSGDGHGPTAAILNPYPRDYRQGKFKFKSTARAAKPTKMDLERIVRYGVPGTAMPAFDLLPDDEIAALVEYVKYLSVRGETEIRLAQAAADLGEGEKLQLGRALLIDETLQPIAESWSTAAEQIINPPEKPKIAAREAIAKGEEVYYGTKGNCAKCHGPSALGDGQTSDYDDWNKTVDELLKKIKESIASIPEQRSAIEVDKELSVEERAKQLKELQAQQAQLEAKLNLIDATVLAPRTTQPRDLRQGIYRGGRRPVDLYRRIHAGINGAPMPGVGPEGTLNPDEIWNLVDYVRSLPYETISKPPRPATMPRRAQL